MQISLIRCVYFGTLQASSDTFISHFIFWPQFTITKTDPMFYPYNIWSCIRLIIFRSYYKWRRWLLFININLVKLWSEPPEFFHFVASFMQMTEVVRVSTVGPSGLQNRLEPLDTQWGFSNLLSCSQMLVNLPALFLFALSSCPRALWLRLGPHAGAGARLNQPAAPIRDVFAGNWTCHLSLVPQALFSATFSQVNSRQSFSFFLSSLVFSLPE